MIHVLMTRDRLYCWSYYNIRAKVTETETIQDILKDDVHFCGKVWSYLASGKVSFLCLQLKYKIAKCSQQKP